jgi:hypothetical protein
MPATLLPKRHVLCFCILCLTLFVSRPLSAQDSSVRTRQFSLESSSLSGLKAKLASDPSLAFFVPFFDNLSQLKKSQYTILGLDIFPHKYRRKISRQIKNSVAIFLELIEHPEKEGRLLPKLEKLTEKLDDIAEQAEDKLDINLGGKSLEVRFNIPAAPVKARV